MLRNADFKDRYGEYHMSLCNINEIVGFNYIKALIYTNLVAGINISIHDKIFYLYNEILCCGYLIIFLFQPDCCIRSFEKAYHMRFTREKSSHICCHLTLHIILMIFGIFCQHKAAYVHNIWCKRDWICTFCLCFVVC